MPTTFWRKLWHILGGSFFPVLAFFLPRLALLITLGVAVAASLALEIARFASPAVSRWVTARLGPLMKSEEKQDRVTGTTYLLLASLVVFLFFAKYVAITSLFFLAIGDFMAALVGRRYGGPEIFGKTMAGSAACLVACLLIGGLMSLTGELGLGVAVAGAVAATVVELLPIPVDDNLTIPIVSAGVMALAALGAG